MGDITMSQDNHQRNPANDAFRLISWNINGLTHCKLLDDILGNFLNKYDIILLCETWTSDQDDIALDGFEFKISRDLAGIVMRSEIRVD